MVYIIHLLSLQLFLPKSCLDAEIEIITLANLNYRPIHINNKPQKKIQVFLSY